MIENLAVIQSAELKLDEGLSVLTGQTGAGKSILIDAINLVLGQRAVKDIVRTGAKKARVEAVFTRIPAKTVTLLQQNGFEIEDDQLLISREISTDGKSSARLMGRAVTAGILREIAPDILNIHGQHDNQMLLDAKKHLHILDLYGGQTAPLEAYQTSYRAFTALKKSYLDNQMDESYKAHRMELLQHEIQEISTAEELLDQEDALTAQVNRGRHAKKLHQALQKSHQALFGIEGEGGGQDAVLIALDALRAVRTVDTEVDQATEQVEDLYAQLQDSIQLLDQLMQSVEYSPAKLSKIEDNLAAIRDIKRKYGGSVETALTHFKQAKQELSAIQLSDKRLIELAEEMRTAKIDVVEKGQALSAHRAELARKFADNMVQELQFLDMPSVCLVVSQTKSKYNVTGCDQIEFLFSTNRGEEPRPLHKIASGGELSRLMLALRCVLAEKEAVGTLIFDEIDVGVSGASAQKIGQKLRQVAQNRQVLCVTHSAQIAAQADQNLLIAKAVDNDRTFTEVIPLDYDGKIEEVARIMATGEITPLLRQTAQAMVDATAQ